ncbi:TetR/AcrR family transcriptional regulator [Nocardioides jishulii]|uniref:TetR/AcrR family transcriptional regulator n=1 Tax=Nocardioides jishulii TaxID=2575440 RepID=A0A4U2YK82_9ACTN|nr:TetR/AcrR family transcriptional regulator [Nocardioides jishulii]QCX26837.1 TetR/AcrR family transcriptional regulator [Nocardioides jishulii]TKI61320.1 TetR/AcrR family transcriptional regulator [Nocardioides jishulii]
MDSQISGRLRTPPSATKEDLLRVARELFTTRGYAATSLDSIVAEAHVTKGALYHHFDGKPGLFAAVHHHVENDAVRRIDAVVDVEDDPWVAVSAGMQAFLEIVCEPSYRRIILEEGPVVLGLSGVRPDERSAFTTVSRLVRATLTAGEWQLPEELLETFSRIMFGAMNSAGAAVANSREEELERARVETSLRLLIGALRQISSQHPSLDAAVATLTSLTSQP